MFITDALSPMQLVRLNAALDRKYRFSNGIRTLRAELENRTANGVEKAESDGMIDYSRTKFNRMGSFKEQDAYIAKLKAKRYYFVNNLLVPKIVFDAIPDAQHQIAA